MLPDTDHYVTIGKIINFFLCIMSSFESLNQGNSIKERAGYLLQIANNSGEKIGEVTDAIINDQLPKATDGRIKILELGTGGGESIATLRKLIGNRSDVDVFASDVSVGILQKIKNEQGISSIAADALKLPLKENSLSAINASAVFHEVSSYGLFGNKLESGNIYGREALTCVFVEIQRALMLGGMLAYRDVFCPNEMFEEKTVVYKSRAWTYFVEWFYPNFLEADVRVFSQDNQLKMEKTNDTMNLTATKHMHRELQRHYLMFRDYLRTQLANTIGLKVIKEDWVDKERGIKTHEFMASGMLYQFASPNGNRRYEKYEMQSDEYDRLFDELIEKILKQELANNSLLVAEMSDWKKREGKEVYTYADIAEILELTCESGAVVRSGHVLFPKTTSDVKILPRNYYNRYLREIIDSPEFDGKQIVCFYKISLQEALQSLDNLEKEKVIKNASQIRKKIKLLV